MLIKLLAIIGVSYLAATAFYIMVKLGWLLGIESWAIALYIRLHTYIFDHKAWEIWKASSDPVKKFWWEK